MYTKSLTEISSKDAEYLAKLVDNKTIAENDFNIANSSYVKQEDTREVVDIEWDK